MSSRTVRLALALALALLVLPGCAEIPGSGRVTKVDDDSGLGESTARYTPAGPVDGSSPQDIVRDFLDAMLAYPVSFKTATSFLTPEAAKIWRPSSRTTVYEQPQVASTSADTVRLGLQVTAELDARGRIEPVDERRKFSWRLEQVDGQWRIADPPEGALITREFFEDYLRPFDLYFLDSTGTRVVPEPVYEVVGDQLPTALATSLALGPANDESDDLRTAVPPLDRLRASVPVDDGVADVEFSVSVPSTKQQEQMSAQIAWTLGQIPGVSAVRIRGDNGLIAPRGEPVQSVTGWDQFGPDPSRRLATIVADDRVFRVDAVERTPLAGAWGKSANSASSVAVGRERVAAVWTDRAEVTRLSGEGGVSVQGRDFLPPVVDVHDVAWLVDLGGRRIRVSQTRTFSEVDGFADGDIRSFAISPDGARYAVTLSDGSVAFGMVNRQDGTLGLGPLRHLRTPVVDAHGVQWVGGERVAYLGTGAVGEQVYSTRIDGTATVTGVPGAVAVFHDGDLDRIVVTQGREPEVFAVDEQQRLWIIDGQEWVGIDVPAVTGIS